VPGVVVVVDPPSVDGVVVDPGPGVVVVDPGAVVVVVAGRGAAPLEFTEADAGGKTGAVTGWADR
jgi:hypothetical protein